MSIKLRLQIVGQGLSEACETRLVRIVLYFIIYDEAMARAVWSKYEIGISI